MAVVIETTLGDITVDLYLEKRPATCLNFLKLCKMKYYNFNLFHMIRSGFIAQTGDPSGEGSGGHSIWGILEGPQKRFFSGEKQPKIRHTDAGLLSMVCTDDMLVGSQFFFTLGPDLDSLDGIHCVIGEVSEGHEVLRKLNDVICDENHRPYQDVRITHTVVLEDPFSDPPGLRAPSRSPSPSAERLKGGRIAPDEELDETAGKSAAEIQEIIEEKEAKARATILEIVGDLPDADIAPPENVLFVCKLNPVTTDEDLEIIFSRFGKIVSCEVIRDKKSGDSLQYAFIEFSDKKSCEDAYFKMDNVLIDDRRIHVDFSQSVSKIKWLGKGRGVKHMNDESIEHNRSLNRSRSKERDIEKKEEFRRHHYKDKYRNDKKDRQIDKYEKYSETLDKDEYRSKKSRNERKEFRHERKESRNERKEPSNEKKESRHESRESRNERKESLNESKEPRHENNESRYEKLESINEKLESSNLRKPRDRSRSVSIYKKSPERTLRHEKNDRNVYDKDSRHLEKTKNYDQKEKHRIVGESKHNNQMKLAHCNSKTDSSPVRKQKRPLSPSPPRGERDSKKKKDRDHIYQNTNSTNNNKKIKENKKDYHDLKEKERETHGIDNKKAKYKNKADYKPTSPSYKKNHHKNGGKMNISKQKRISKNRNVKKNRKPSTSSSDTTSTDSSSSTESSSSSERSRKKKNVNRRKKKYSSSSSSSSSSSTSSDSSLSSSSDSSSSSDDTSSSSDNDVKKKKKVNKKIIQKKQDNKKRKVK